MCITFSPIILISYLYLIDVIGNFFSKQTQKHHLVVYELFSSNKKENYVEFHVELR